MIRQENLNQLQERSAFDVAILGGGINGACLFDTLCRRGYRVLLLDRADFGGGTSQASGMMVWGGLLYLTKLDLLTVLRLSGSRERLLRELPDEVRAQLYRYLPARNAGRARCLVHAGLWLYWLLGLGRRRAPRAEERFAELPDIQPATIAGSLVYEEAVLASSDTRFVLQWITPHRQPGQVALNYCAVAGQYCASDGCWRLDLRDLCGGGEYSAHAKAIVNCGGVWADEINRQFGIATPYRHAFSKGVYLSLPRLPRDETPLIFELSEHNDIITSVPWGPVSLWGPTETTIHDLQAGHTATPQDVAFLLEHYNRRFVRAADKSDIVSMRCGVRPLVVHKDFHHDCYPLELSRRQVIHRNPARRWVSCYGGKITDCTTMAAGVLRVLTTMTTPSDVPRAPEALPNRAAAMAEFPGLAEKVHTPGWCRRHEFCCTLDDYLRRRTNIAQWVPRQGLGRQNEHRPLIRQLAQGIHDGDATAAEHAVQEYESRVREGFDQVLSGV